MLSMANSDLQQYRSDMTADEISLAATGWGLTTANMNLPANIGDTAESEVHDALAAVIAAKPLPRIARGNQPGGVGTDAENTAAAAAYVRAMSKAFNTAIDVSTRVGVITG